MKRGFKMGKKHEYTSEQYEDKMTDIITLTNIFCSALRFDEEAYEKYINYIFDNDKIWVYNDTEHYICNDEDINVVLLMPNVNKPLSLIVAVKTGIGTNNAGILSLHSNGDSKLVMLDEKLPRESRAKIYNLLYFCEKLWKRVKKLGSENGQKS